MTKRFELLRDDPHLYRLNVTTGSGQQYEVNLLEELDFDLQTLDEQLIAHPGKMGVFCALYEEYRHNTDRLKHELSVTEARRFEQAKREELDPTTGKALSDKRAQNIVLMDEELNELREKLMEAEYHTRLLARAVELFTTRGSLMQTFSKNVRETE